MHYTSIDLKSVILFDGLFIQTQENISNFTLQEKDSKNQINPKSNIEQSDMLWSNNQRSPVLSLLVILTFSGKLLTRLPKSPPPSGQVSLYKSSSSRLLLSRLYSGSR